MNETTEHARKLLEAHNAVQAPSAAVQARVWNAVVARATTGDLGPDLGTTSTVSATGGGLSVWTVAVVLAVAAAIGIPWLMSTTEDNEEHGAVEVAPVERTRIVADKEPSLPLEPAPLAVAKGQNDEPAAIEQERGPEPAFASTREKAEKKRERVRGGEVGGGPQLGPEMELMVEARTALGAGDARRALQLLDRHRQRFPDGLFAAERDVSSITALCALGRIEAAREATEAFLARYPTSALRSRVEASCGTRKQSEASTAN